MARSRRAPIRLREVTVYRDKSGRFAPKSKETRRRAATYKLQVSESGKVLRGIEVLSKRRVVKTAFVDGSAGAQPGNIFWAMARTNVTTQLKGAKRIRVTITGKDHREKAKRTKLDINTASVKKNLGDLMLGKILSALRQKGFRTQYDIEEVKGTRRGWKSRARKLKQLHDVTLVIELDK